MWASPTAEDKVHLTLKSLSFEKHIYVIYDFASARATHVNLITGIPLGPYLYILTKGVSGEQIRANMLALMPNSPKSGEIANQSTYELYQAVFEDKPKVDEDQAWQLLFESLNIVFM